MRAIILAVSMKMHSSSRVVARVGITLGLLSFTRFVSVSRLTTHIWTGALMTTLPFFRVLPLLVASLVLPHTVFAGEDELDSDTKPLWELALAGYGLYAPAYPGSVENQGNFLPLPIPIYRGKFLRLGEDSEKPIRGRIFRSDRVRLDLDMDLNFGSKSGDIDARVGMPDLDPLIEMGPELELKFTSQPSRHGNWFFAPQLRGAVSLDGLSPEWRGFTFSPELRYVRHLEKRGSRLKLRFTPTFAGSDYMDYFYRVEPAYSTSQRPAYEAKSGYLGTTLGLSLQHPVTDAFEIRAGVRIGMLQGARNASSPLFTDDTTQSVYVAFLYKFWASKRTTTAEDVF